LAKLVKTKTEKETNAKMEKEIKIKATDLLYYIISNYIFFDFLRNQINKFCLGFEYTL